MLTTGAHDEPLDGGASTQHAYESLRGLILSGELEPGAAFSQVQLASQLGISRTPLREAVRRLQTEGLLRSEPNRRVRVSPLSTDDFEDLYAMRIALDSLAVRLTIPELTGDELAGLRDACESSNRAVERGDADGYHRDHERFHFGLFAHGGPRLTERVHELWDHAARYRRLYVQHAGDERHLIELASRDHAAILDAAERRAAAEGGRLMAEHVARTALMTIAQVDHRHDPVRIRGALDLVYAKEPAGLPVQTDRSAA